MQTGHAIRAKLAGTRKPLGNPPMLQFAIQLALTALLIMLVSNLVRGIVVKDMGSALLAALVLGLVNALIKPLVVLLTLPVTLLTLGLFLFVINALMLMLTSAIVKGFHVNGFIPALLGSLLLSVLNLLVAWVFGIG